MIGEFEMADDERAKRSVNRRILALAVPTFGQLIAEPAFVLIDTAIVGHVGDSALAGLSVGSTIVLTVVGLCVFLAYGTTSRVARLMGAGRRREGLEAGISGLWLALAIGIVVSVALFVLARPICLWMGAGGVALDDAVAYLRAVVFGLPGMLLVYAANGIFRGLAKVTITLVAAVAGAILNTVLDVALILGCGWGVFGSGVGTLIAQWFMAVVLIVPALLWARQEGASLRPRMQGIKASMGDGLVLFIRTLALRACLMATVMLAARMGVRVLAAYQAVNSTWNFVLNMLDAIGIAGQSLVAAEIGAERPQRALRMTRAAGRAGLAAGIVIGIGLIALGLIAPPLFSASVPVRHLIAVGMVVVGVTLPLSGWMWAVDGILIGAGDYRYLAATCIITACIYLPSLAGIGVLCNGSAVPDTVRMTALWAAVTLLFIGIRAIFNALRVRGDAWLNR
jgi:putative MATE family efflux protein